MTSTSEPEKNMHIDRVYEADSMLIVYFTLVPPFC